jgi:hypothetical protein
MAQFRRPDPSTVSRAPILDPAAADWIVHRVRDWGPPGMALPTVGSLLPPGFDRYIRIDSVDPKRLGSLDHLQAQVLIPILRTATQTPDQCFLCIWSGYGWGWLTELQPFANVAAPHRRYVMFQGGLAAINMDRDGAFHSPSLWWPLDRHWCVATDVDLASTYVGCSAQTAFALSEHPRLQCDIVGLDDFLAEPA